MGFNPGEKRSDVLLLGQVTLAVVKLNNYYQQGAGGLTTDNNSILFTFPASPAKVWESSSSFSSLLAQPTTLMPALIKSKHRYLTAQQSGGEARPSSEACLVIML